MRAIPTPSRIHLNFVLVQSIPDPSFTPSNLHQPCRSGSLFLDSNLHIIRLLLRLRDAQRKNPVLHMCLYMVWVDRVREAERAAELADLSLGAPELASLGLLAFLGRCVGALGAAVDTEGLRIAKLDLDILALYTRQLAMETVAVLMLLDIELWLPGLQLASNIEIAVVVEVVEETEERGECRVGVEKWSWNERHDWNLFRF